MKASSSLLILILSILLLTTGCKNPDKISGVPEVPMTVPQGFSKTGIDATTMDMILSKGDHIDYIFNSLPLSMNQDGQESVYQEMRYISNQAIPGIPTECSPIARKIYIGNGEIIMESDLYFSNNCLFQIFIKDEKPLFGNMLSQEGLTFYVNLMTQARESMPEDVRSRYIIPEVN